MRLNYKCFFVLTIMLLCFLHCASQSSINGSKPDLLILIQEQRDGSENVLVNYLSPISSIQLSTESVNAARILGGQSVKTDHSNMGAQNLAQISFRTGRLINVIAGQFHITEVLQAFSSHKKIQIHLIAPNFIYTGPMSWEDPAVTMYVNPGGTDFRTIIRIHDPSKINISLTKPIKIQDKQPEHKSLFSNLGLMLGILIILAVGAFFLVYYILSKRS